MLKIDLLCAIKYLSDDRRAKKLPNLMDLGVFLRGSDLSRRKTFTHKYDLYGKYKSITNDEVKAMLDECAREHLASSNGGFSLTKEGIAMVKENKPEAFINPYIKSKGFTLNYLFEYHKV